MRFKSVCAAITAFATIAFSGTLYAETNFNSKGLIWRSDDGQFSLRAGGRFHYDIVQFDEDKTSLEDGASLRRGRFYISGRATPDWRFKVEREFTQAGKGWKNLWLSYRGLDDSRITFGNQLAPFGLENPDSSNHIKLIERSLASSLGPSYYMGGSYSRYWDDFTISAGAFTDGLREGGVNTNEGEWSVDARATYAPIHKRKKTVHLGGSVEYRKMDNGKPLSLSARPEVGIAKTKRLVSTGNINSVDSTIGVGLDAAGSYNNFLAQAEYVSRKTVGSAAGDEAFDGGYVQGAWVITGERQRYSQKSGHFKIKPKRKWGAVEAAARYSYIDLNEGNVRGGEQDNITLGLNWYINENARVMTNYIWMDVDQDGAALDESPDALLTRFQIHF